MANELNSESREGTYYLIPGFNMAYAYSQKRYGVMPKMNLSMLVTYNTMCSVVGSSAIYAALDALHLI